MKLVFSEVAWRHRLEWQGDDQRTLAKVNDLVRDCKQDPSRGLGKPEPLEGNLKGWWSRRISGEHRLVYRVTGKGDAQALEVAQCPYHYQSSRALALLRGDIVAERLVDAGLVAAALRLEPRHHVGVDPERQLLLDGSVEPTALGIGPVCAGEAMFVRSEDAFGQNPLS